MNRREQKMSWREQKTSRREHKIRCGMQKMVGVSRI